MKWTCHEDVALLDRGERGVKIEPLEHGVHVSIDVGVVNQVHEI